MLCAAHCLGDVSPGTRPSCGRGHKTRPYYRACYCRASGVYVALAPITYPAGVSASADWAMLIVKVSVVGALFGMVVSFWRPAFVFLPAAVVMQQKAVAAMLFDTGISKTDYIPVLAMAGFQGKPQNMLNGSSLLMPAKRHMLRSGICESMR